ncbi:MAG TPA: hypothetical protein PLN69_04950 [bacterium]|nr:hypothetical protein [bacterium]
MDMQAINQAAQGVVNLTETSTQKQSKINESQQTVEQTRDEASKNVVGIDPSQYGLLAEKIKQIAEQLSENIASREQEQTAGEETSPSVDIPVKIPTVNELVEYHNNVLSEVDRIKTDLPVDSVDLSMPGELPRFPFDQHFFEIYEEYVQKMIEEGKTVPKEVVTFIDEQAAEMRQDDTEQATVKATVTTIDKTI